MNRLLHSMPIGLLAFVALGCGGGSSGLKLVPISGVVKHNNAPVANASLVFYPEKGPAGLATTDQSGAFRVQTNGQSGGTAGKNKITVTIKPSNVIPPSDGRAVEFKNESSKFKNYADQQETPLNIEIPAAGDQKLNLDLVE